MKKSKGFTLIEAIISMAVLSMAIAAVFYGYIAVANIFIDEMRESDVHIEINRPVEQMSTEIRNTLEIVSSSAHSITFWHKDLNDNSSRESNETITYSWNGVTDGYIVRTLDSSSKIVASGIQDFNLTYNSTAAASLVFIDITVGRDGKISTLETSVQCRNL